MASERVVERRDPDRCRDLPDELGVVGDVVERGVADQGLADEQDDVGEKAESEHDGEHRADLGQDVVGPGQRPGEDDRQHSVATIGTHDVGPGDGDEDEQGDWHADVLAVAHDLHSPRPGCRGSGRPRRR